MRASSNASFVPIAGHLLIVAGTRPEAIKLAPVVCALLGDNRIPISVIAAGQQAAEVSRVFADWDLRAMHLPQMSSRSHWRVAEREQRHRLRALFRALGADAIMVQGDTWSAYAAARAADELGRSLIHVEAGLRSPDPRDPYPEDALRRLISRRAWLHFAPTDTARNVLIDEGIAESQISVSGSTAADALRRLMAQPQPVAISNEPIGLMVTVHRRENWDGGLQRIFDALDQVMRERPALRVLWPLHSNPILAARVRERFAEQAQMVLNEPLPQREFVEQLRRCGRILSDSGGVQEEVPYLGAAALIARRCSERPQSEDSGHARLCAADDPNFMAELNRLLDRPRPAATPFDQHAPWGDGRAGTRIAQWVIDALLKRAVVQPETAQLAHA